MQSQKSIKKNILINFFRTFLTLAFPLITFPYASRILLPEGLGRVNFAQSIVSYFSVIASLGIFPYGVREISKNRDNKIELNKTATSLFCINLLSMTISLCILFVVLFCVPKLSTYRTLIWICSINIIFATINFEWIYTAFEDFAYITIRSFIFQVIGLIILFLFVKSEDDIFIYALIGVFSSAGAGILNFLHVRKYISFVNVNLHDLKRHIKPIMFFFASTVANSVYTILDTSMLGLLTNDYQVGIYAAATKINRLVLSLVITIGSVLLPRLSYLRKNDMNAYQKLLEQSLSTILCISIPCVIGLEVLSKDIISLFCGNSYFDAVIVMQLINPIILIVALGNFCGVQIMIPEGLEKKSMYIICGAAIINFILNFIMIPFWGAKGAASASLIAELFVTIVNLYFCRNLVHINIVLRYIGKYLFYSLIMAAIIIPIRMFTENIIFLFITILVGMCVYGLCLFIFKDPILLLLTKKKNRQDVI